MRRDLSALAEKISAVEMRRWAHSDHPPVATGLPDLDNALPHRGLLRGAIHEWLGPDDDRATSRPPFTLLLHLAARAADTRRIIFIGERAWPYAHPLARAGLLDHSLFIAARTPHERTWATDLALRSPAAACVITDGGGLDRTALRRLQLSAEAGNTLGLLARPACDAADFSSAATRWLIRRVPAPTTCPPTTRQRWTIELLRCKGVQPTLGPRTWTLELDHATGALHIPPVLADRPAHPATRTARAG
jgi:protein ImuA